MFDPKLTIESGIDRLGEIVDGRQIEVKPDDTVFNSIREMRLNLQVLFDNDAVKDLGLLGLDLQDDRFRNEYEKVFPNGQSPLGRWWKAQQKTKKFSMMNLNSTRLLDAALMNVFEYASGQISIRHLMGSNGEFYLLAQESDGPAFDEPMKKFLRGEDLKYLNGKQQRGVGFQNYAKSDDSVWYADMNPGYATLIFAPTKSSL